MAFEIVAVLWGAYSEEQSVYCFRRLDEMAGYLGGNRPAGGQVDGAAVTDGLEEISDVIKGFLQIVGKVDRLLHHGLRENGQHRIILRQRRRGYDLGFPLLGYHDEWNLPVLDLANILFGQSAACRHKNLPAVKGEYRFGRCHPRLQVIRNEFSHTNRLPQGVLCRIPASRKSMPT